MTLLECIIDFHRTSERQGPGSDEDTLKALSFTDLAGNRPLAIADIGCGTGASALILASHCRGSVTAIDLFPEFLEELNTRATLQFTDPPIKTLQASMDDLPLQKEEFDLIWSEGAIYNIGFEKGIRQWKDFLKPGGYLAVSEITWLTGTRPKAIEDFWTSQYPEIDTAANRIRQLEYHGYSLTGYFNLAPESWINTYYDPMESRFKEFLEKHDHSETARKVVEDHRSEIALYHTYKKFYSYGFYVARKDR